MRRSAISPRTGSWRTAILIAGVACRPDRGLFLYWRASNFASAATRSASTAGSSTAPTARSRSTASRTSTSARARSRGCSAWPRSSSKPADRPAARTRRRPPRDLAGARRGAARADPRPRGTRRPAAADGAVPRRRRCSRWTSPGAARRPVQFLARRARRPVRRQPDLRRRRSGSICSAAASGARRSTPVSRSPDCPRPSGRRRRRRAGRAGPDRRSPPGSPGPCCANIGFRLDRSGTGLRRRRGLLTLTDVTLPLRRAQAAIVGTGPLRERFGWRELKLQSLAKDEGGKGDHVVAPLAREEEVAAHPRRTRLARSLRRPSGGAFRRAYAGASSWLAGPARADRLAAVRGSARPACWARCAAAAADRDALASWRRNRYALDDDRLLVEPAGGGGGW